MTDEPDDFARIYQGCQQRPLFRAMLTLVEKTLPHVKATGNEIHLWSDGLLGSTMKDIKKHGLHFELLSDMKSITDTITRSYDSLFGPRLTTIASGNIPLTCGHIIEWNLDEPGATQTAKFKLCEDEDEWHNTGLAHAASAYRRCCHWDFAPGEAGVWICYYVPTDGMGGSDADEWYYHGNLVGFVILYDRANKGRYESVGHIWTAEAARRRGIARDLIAYAREHYPVHKVEGPYTDDGACLLRNAWPEIFERDA